MRNSISYTTKQKMKTAAKYTGYTAGGALVLGSVVAVGLSVVNNLFKPEYLSKLGENNLFKIAAFAGFIVLTAAVGFHLFRKTDKELQEENQQLEQDNQTLIAGINFVANADETKTDLAGVKADQVFAAAQQIASPA